jgi:tetratricopeptide (TPR) repeat protein
MGFLKSIFGPTSTPEEEKEKIEKRQFETLRDNGVRALQMGEIKLALPYLEKALELRPDDRAAKAYLAEALLRQQDYATALPHLRLLAAEETEGIELRLLLANALGKTDDYAAMRDTLTPLLATSTDDARVAYLAAVAAHGLHDDFTAIALLTQALAQHDDYIAARALRARILSEMGQWHEALDDTTFLMDSQTADEDTALLHGKGLAATGNHDGADATFRQLLDDNPFCIEAFQALAQLHAADNRLDKALDVCNEGIAACPTAGVLYRLRGGIRLQLHDEAGAADDLKKALEIDPQLAQQVDGEFSNMENRLNDRYRALNPYQF